MLQFLAPLIALGSSPSLADHPIWEERIEVFVHHDDLDLSSAEGKKRLQHRLRHAVQQACPLMDARNLAERVHVNSCRKAASAHASMAYDKAVGNRLASQSN